MNLIDLHRSKDFIEDDQRIFEVFSLLGAVIAPIFAYICIRFDSELTIQNKMAFSIIPLYFILLYFLIHVNTYIKERLRNLLYLGYYLASSFTIYSAYSNLFTNEHTLLVMLISFSISLAFNNIKHLLCYLGTILVLVIIALSAIRIQGNTPAVNGLFLGISIFTFSAVIFINMFMRKRILKTFLNSRRNFQSLLDASPDGIIVHKDGNILYANKSVASIVHLDDPEALVGKSVFDFLRKEDYEIAEADIEKILTDNGKDYKEEKLILANNFSVDVEVASIVTTYNGSTSIMTILRDISQRKIMEQELIETEDKYRKIVEGALIGVYLYQNEKLIYVNKYMEEIFGYSPEEFYSIEFFSLISEEDKAAAYTIKDNLLSGTKEHMVEVRCIRKDGSPMYVQAHVKAINYKGAAAIIGMVLDITEQKKAEERIKQMALYDSLTALPNRYLLDFQLKETLEARENTDTGFAIMFIDLDGFKAINDTLGHGFGDAVLKKASLEIKRCLDENDFISRYGGDEFVAIIEDGSKEKLDEKIHRIIHRFANPLTVNGSEIIVTPSIGISLSPSDSRDAETLIKYADAAMYQAKSAGNNNSRYYTSELHDAVIRKSKMESGLRMALKSQEFNIHYQAQIDLNKGCIYGAEALLRWNSPELGSISPVEFIPLAEETGLIIPIGEWILKSACIQCKTWHELGLSPISISVNVSYRQLIDRNFIKVVMEALSESRLEPQYLELEITETMLKNIEELNPVINELKSMGLRISIDDFGVGYSSLSLLQDVTIDTLKIDKSFIENLMINSKASAIVKTTIAMGTNLNFRIIAEGVETEEQMRFLMQNNCDIVQGFLFSRPSPAEEFEKFLNNYSL